MSSFFPHTEWSKSEGIPLQQGLETLYEEKTNEKEVGSTTFLL